MSPHISFDEDTKEKLAERKSKRGKSVSHWVREAVDLLLSVEHPEIAKQIAIRVVVNRNFSIPQNTPHWAFFSFLYLLAENYPDQNARDFWGRQVYLGDPKSTHKEIRLKIDKELAEILSKNDASKKKL